MTHHDLLIGDAEPDALGQPLRLEEVPQRLGQRGHVGDLAVTDHARGEIHARRARDAIGGRLNRGEVRAVQVETDRPAVGMLAERQCHVASLQTRYRPLREVL